MSDLLTTIIAGVSVFVAGQLLIKFLIEPLYEFRMLIGRILYALTYYTIASHSQHTVAEIEVQSAATPNQTMQMYGGLAAELVQRVYAIPLYRVWAFVFRRWLPSMGDIWEASTELIRLSRGPVGSIQAQCNRAIRVLLKLPHYN